MIIIKDDIVQNCTCTAVKEPHIVCDGPLRLDEKGVKAELKLKKGELAQLIILDNCLCGKSGKKCDTLFLFQDSQKKSIISVELKGTHVEDGVEQLAETRRRREYIELKDKFQSLMPVLSLREQAFLVSSEILSIKDQYRLRKDWRISFTPLVVNRGVGKVVDLRREF